MKDKNSSNNNEFSARERKLLEEELRRVSAGIRKEHPSDWREILKTTDAYKKLHNISDSENQNEETKDASDSIKNNNPKNNSKNIVSKKDVKNKSKNNSKDDSSINKLSDIENKLKNNHDLINDFFSDIDNGFLSFEKRNEMIVKYSPIYDIISELNKFSDSHKQKIFLEFDNLERFLKVYNDLLNYFTLSSTSKDNKIRKINENELDTEINENKDFIKEINDVNKKSSIVIDEKNKEVNAVSMPKVSIHNIPPYSSKSSENILSEILNAIDEGYKFIVLEENEWNSDIVVKLANNFKSSIILTANEKSQMRYNKKYKLRKNSNIYLSNQIKFFDDFEKIEKSDILIIDDAHRLDENIVNLFSYPINLSKYDELVNKFKCKVKDLPEKDYSLWIDFINYLSLDDEKIKRIVTCIKENPRNWICSYNSMYNRFSFYPLNIGNLAKEYYFSKSKTCILISSTILDFELFATELGLDISHIKFIRFNLPFNSDKNKIYARKTVNMQNNNLSLLISLIKEILEKHQNEKGLILTNRFTISNELMREIKNQRLLTYRNFDYYKKLKKFKESFNSVMVTDFLEDGIEFPYNQCKFQIIVKQHNYPNNRRSKDKEKENNWYSYKQIINLMGPLQRPITSENDYCTTYILDEGVLKSITKDIIHNNFIPKYIINLFVDLDMENSGVVSDNIKKQFGVYYLFDYDKHKRHENKKLWDYKSYNKEIPNMYDEEFNYFTTKLMEAISELSNHIIDAKFNKLALVSVPSSTVERDNLATVKESINVIEGWYKEGKSLSAFDCKREIINCGNLLKRVIDVNTSHKSNMFHKSKRVSYIEHMDSIGCEKKDILNEDDVAFIILDDVSTRGTIMNVCEDILINNGVKKENIYKFALSKTVW